MFPHAHAFPGDYLKSGIAYAFHPHRDTWYSAPFCQINWWMPIYDLNSENCMAIHPHYFGRSIKNGSRDYNYHKWNLESRQNAAQHVKTDTRVQPRSEEPVELEPQVRLVCKVGGAYQFSQPAYTRRSRILPMSCATASIFARYTWAMFWDGLERRMSTPSALAPPWVITCVAQIYLVFPGMPSRCITTALK